MGPQEPDRGFVEWLLGAVGINQRPTDQVVAVPGTCPPCSKLSLIICYYGIYDKFYLKIVV